jgi:PAS domain S-box-containing protein
MSVRILVVEDNRESLELMRYLLAARGCEVLVAAEGAAAVEIAQRARLDLILCDVQMPGMDGYEVLRTLRADSALDHVPLIAVTALAAAGDRQALTQAGFDGVLPKPIAPESFAEEALGHLAANADRHGHGAHPSSSDGVDGNSILVVDDHAANREFLCALLGYKGHRLLEAADGLEALEIVRAQHPRLVICDILMPTMDGYEFVRQLRADALIADTAVVYCTAHYHEREAQSLARACGVAHVITKPCEPALVLQIVEQVLREPQQHREVLPEKIHSDHLRLITDKLSQKTEQLQAANEKLNALVDLNLQLASQRDIFRLLDEVCLGARKLIGARCGILGIQGKENGKTAHFVSSGVDPDVAGSFGLPPLNRGVFSRLFAGDRACRIADTGGVPALVGLPANYPLSASLLAAPIASPTLVHGWVCLTDKLGGAEFTAEDERLLSILAAQLGQIYENSNLYATMEHHAAQLEFEISERWRAEAAARSDDARYRELIEQAADGIFLTDADNNFVMVNSWGCELLGYSRDELLRMNGHDTYVEEDRVLHAERMEQARAGEPLRFERMVRRKDGTAFPAEVSVKTLTSGLMQVIFHDITVRRAHERKIARLSRIHSMLSGINSAIVRIRDRDALFKEACRLAVEHGGFSMVWIGLLDDGRTTVKPVARAGQDAGFLDSTPLSVNVDAAGHGGAVGQALRSMNALVINDVANDPAVHDKQEYAKRGYRSAIILPLVVRNAAIGVLSLYAAEADVFDEEVLHLLQELAGDIAFGVESGRQS